MTAAFWDGKSSVMFLMNGQVFSMSRTDMHMEKFHILSYFP